ncbi:uncharacterized protein LOC144797637 [Lissotriton helveticus]
MRQASFVHIVLRLGLLGGCFDSSAAPSESTRSLVRGIPGFESGLSEGLQEKNDKVTIVWKENKNQTSHCTFSSRKPVKKRMLPADELLNAEPTGKYLYFVHGQNATRMLTLVSSETSDQNDLALLPKKGRRNETRKLPTSINRKQGYSNLDTDFLKGLLKNKKHASLGFFGEVAVINIKIKEILRSSKSVKPNFSTVSPSTETLGQLIVSSETSQTYSKGTVEKSKMNVPLLLFPNFKVMLSDGYSDNVKGKISLERNSVINTESRITVSDGKVKHPMKRFKEKIEFEMVNFPEDGSPKNSLKRNDLIVDATRTEQSNDEEQVQWMNAIEMFAPIIKQSTSFSEITISTVPVVTHYVISDETVPFLKKQAESTKRIEAFVSSGRHMLVSPRNYNFSHGDTGIHQHKQEEQIKNNGRENLARRRQKQLNTFSLSRTLPPISVKKHGFSKAVSTSLNKNDMRSMNGGRTNLLNFLFGGRSSISLENFHLSKGFKSNDPHKQEEPVKNGIETIEIKNNKLFQAEVQRPVLTGGYEGSFVWNTGVYPNQHDTQQKNRGGLKVRRNKNQLRTFSEIRKLPVFLWKDHLPITVKETNPFKIEEHMKNAVETTEKPLVTTTTGVTFTPILMTRSLDTFPNTQKEQTTNSTEKTTGTTMDALSEVRSPLMSPTKFDNSMTNYSETQVTFSDQQTNISINSENVVFNQTSLEPTLTRVDNLELRTSSKVLHSSFTNTSENKQDDVQPLLLHDLIIDLVMKITDLPTDTHIQETNSSSNVGSLSTLIPTSDFDTMTHIDSTINKTFRTEVSESKNRDL